METVLVDKLLQTYPDCDRMMAETIVKMHLQNKLEDFMSELRGEGQPLEEGTIVISPAPSGPEIKSPVNI